MFHGAYPLTSGPNDPLPPQVQPGQIQLFTQFTQFQREMQQAPPPQPANPPPSRASATAAPAPIDPVLMEGAIMSPEERISRLERELEAVKAENLKRTGSLNDTAKSKKKTRKGARSVEYVLKEKKGLDIKQLETQKQLMVSH
jgi:hypothetical protein